MAKLLYEYSNSKNRLLVNERNISFEEIIAALNNGRLLDIVEQPSQSKHPNQKAYIVQVNNYVYMVPFVKKDEQTIFLKTIFPSRKAKKLYKKRGIL